MYERFIFYHSYQKGAKVSQHCVLRLTYCNAMASFNKEIFGGKAHDVFTTAMKVISPNTE
jgi:hypothetical protein